MDSLRIAIATADIASRAQCTKVINFRLSTLGPRLDMVNVQNQAGICWWITAAQGALEMIAVHDLKAKTPWDFTAIFRRFPFA